MGFGRVPSGAVWGICLLSALSLISFKIGDPCRGFLCAVLGLLYSESFCYRYLIPSTSLCGFRCVIGGFSSLWVSRYIVCTSSCCGHVIAHAFYSGQRAILAWSFRMSGIVGVFLSLFGKVFIMVMSRAFPLLPRPRLRGSSDLIPLVVSDLVGLDFAVLRDPHCLAGLVVWFLWLGGRVGRALYHLSLVSLRVVWCSWSFYAYLVWHTSQGSCILLVLGSDRCGLS